MPEWWYFYMLLSNRISFYDEIEKIVNKSIDLFQFYNILVHIKMPKKFAEVNSKAAAAR